ncbi:hypothetical protein F4692_000825 [Nocardioides cavernae]|uniref:Uncharacterized protein n=1 Tax=Nocardioides cavernae TaxID=1921566 RepID=A0A7Y9H0H5_9ACTN|nr:hypothetical protein [Nocardioides cavernae]NYE35721.1 hypothetical protein [Nocardioides cavernae]
MTSETSPNPESPDQANAADHEDADVTEQPGHGQPAGAGDDEVYPEEYENS